MKNRLAAALAVNLAILTTQTGWTEPARVRRMGPPPRPFERAEMPAGSTEVPMLGEGRALVEVRIDGKGPYRFALDAGATGGFARGWRTSSASRWWARRSRATPRARTARRWTSWRPARWRSAVSPSPASSWPRASCRRCQDARRPRSTASSVWGLFADHLLTLDYPARKVRIETGSLPPADGREILDFENPHGIPSVRIEVGGIEVAADVDSGNSRGELVLPASYLGKVPLEGEPQEMASARTTFNEVKIRQARLKGAARVGGHSVERPLVDFVEIFSVASLGDAFLRRFAVTIDQKGHRIPIPSELTVRARGTSC